MPCPSQILHLSHKQLFENVRNCSQKQRLAADVQYLKWYGVQARAGEANRQVFLLLCAAKSAPLRQQGWRPSVQQSKLNLQMCLCSKYLSPAGYYLSPDGVWAHSLQKSNQPLLMSCERPSLLLNVWAHDPRTKSSQSTKKNCSTTHFSMLGWEKPYHNQSWRFTVVIRKSFQWSSSSITALLICPCNCQETSDQILHYWKLDGSSTDSVNNVTQGRAFHGPTTASANVLSDLYPGDGLQIDKPCFISREASWKNTKEFYFFLRELMGLTVLF